MREHVLKRSLRARPSSPVPGWSALRASSLARPRRAVVALGALGATTALLVAFLAAASPVPALGAEREATPGTGASCSGTASSYTITAVAGTPQSAKVGEPFATSLEAQVLESTATGSCPAAGVVVTFSAPSSGASASFNGGSVSASVATDQNGDATAPALYAGPQVGTYQVAASVSVSSAEASFTLSNTTVGAVALAQASSGSGQSAVVGTAFAEPLSVLVQDAYGGPVAGAQVSFVVVSAQGAGASFLGGAATAQATTNAQGQATSPPLTAGATSGSFSVTATVASGGTVAASATFRLTDLPGEPYSLATGAGSGQQAALGTRFAVPLAVTVTDQGGNPVAGALVSFSAPARGPSGVFSGAGRTASVRAGADGVATAPAFVAGMQSGGYVVRAQVAGLAQVAAFALVNTARPGASAPGPAGAYWAATSRGPVLSSGGAPRYGWPRHPKGPVVAMAARPEGDGYWLASAQGGVYAYGAARYLGSPAHVLGRVVALQASPDGAGYWLATSAGALYAYGDAAYYGSPAGAHLHLGSPIVALAALPSGRGYWLVGRQGGVYAYGAARYLGSAKAPRSPIVGAASAPGGEGYWLVASAGAVYAYGRATFYGSAVGLLSRPATGLVLTADGAGYWVLSANGTVAGFGDAGAQGSGAPPKGASVVAGAAA